MGCPCPVVKVIEPAGESERRWEHAARKEAEAVTPTLRGVASARIEEFQAIVENDPVKNFRANAKVSAMERTYGAAALGRRAAVTGNGSETGAFFLAAPRRRRAAHSARARPRSWPADRAWKPERPAGRVDSGSDRF